MRILRFFAILRLIFIASCNLAPGSYPYAEEYIVDSTEPIMIKEINKFKSENPQYNLPNNIELSDGRRDSLDLWYHVYFYLPDRKEIIKTWIRQKNKAQLTFAIVAINKGNGLGNWLYVNKDLNHAENSYILSRFEKEILSKIKSGL